MICQLCDSWYRENCINMLSDQNTAMNLNLSLMTACIIIPSCKIKVLKHWKLYKDAYILQESFAMTDKSYLPPCRNYVQPLYLSVTLYACAHRVLSMYVNWACFTTETWYSRCCCINTNMNNEKNNAYRFRTKRWLSAILETHTKNTHSHTNYVGPPVYGVVNIVYMQQCHLPRRDIHVKLCQILLLLFCK